METGLGDFMKRFKVVLWLTVVGAAVGVLVTRPGLHSAGNPAASILDKSVTTRWPWIAAALGWVVFSLYWEAAAKNVAAAKSAESAISRGIHVFLTNAALLLEVVPLRGVSRFVPLSTAAMIAGLAVETIGLALAILARRHLGCYWSGEISIKVDHRLIRSGPYRMLRHPIYTGLLTMYAGTALVTGTWLAVGGFALAALAYARKVRLEEANLNVAFGAEYEAYRRESWALVPGLF
jgi:protein-S-isoprenylcysteine O-methyltransferase Ste14